MKLGVSYTVFDGIELLEHSIKQIRNHVDFIHVAYQKYSWFNKEMSIEDFNTLNRLKKIGLIDSLECFTNFKTITPKGSNIQTSKKYETEKRQFGMDACLKKNCTHFISMDVDEFYVSEEFKKAKNIILENNISQSSCSFINYVKLPIYTRGIDSSTVPFICKINRNSLMSKGFFTKCDPTRGITDNVPGVKKRFTKDILIMHHMETVRKDLNKKYESTTRAIFKRERTKDLIKGIKSVNEQTNMFSFNKIIFPGTPPVKLKKTNNIFNIPYKTWDL